MGGLVGAAAVLSREPRPTFVEALSGADARQRFAAEHVAGAVLIGLEDELSAIGDPRHGGRHPLPAPEAFAAVLSRHGIRPEDPIAVLDDRDGSNAAARLYVMLRAIGHRDVSLVAGGVRAMKAAGAAMASGEPIERAPSQPSYPARPWSIPLVPLADIAAKIAAGAVVLDARAAERYRGETEPFDPTPGHVPGARNVPYAELLDASGAFVPQPELVRRFTAAGVKAGAEVIVHCGSGVTACMLMIALEAAGLATIGEGGPGLWVGGYSEWSRNDLPIARST